MIKTTPIFPESSVEMPMARGLDDVDEDYQVINMSNIAAPVIEFELPNLRERKLEIPVNEVEKSDKITARQAKKSEISSQKIQLTAESLNNELVGLRSTILTAKNQLMRKLVRQKKQLKVKTEKNEGQRMEEKERKIARLVEEILGLKTVDKDAIAKFAALNSKSLNQLNINGKTPVSERLMYKLACHNTVIEKINAIREKYVEWSKTSAFFMQRLGQQYASKPEKLIKKSDNADESDHDSEVVEDSSTPENTPEDSVGSEDDGEFNESDVEMVDSDDDGGEKAAKERRNLLLRLIGVKEDESRPALNPKKRKIKEDEYLSGEHKKTREDARKERFNKALKMKEVINPKKSAPRPKKATQTALGKVKKSEKVEKDAAETEQKKEVPNQKTLVMKVNLSKGGKIEKIPKLLVRKPQIPQDDNTGDDDESASFFLPKSRCPSTRRTVANSKKELEVTEKKGKKAEVLKKKQPAPPVPSSFDKKKGSSKKNQLDEMHPSWIASQLKKKETAAAKPCGKKTKFADSDDE